MKAFARELRRQQTDAETKLWYFLRNRNLFGCKFRRQEPIGPYIVDFFCLDQNLIVELDGGQHAENQEKDSARTKYLEGLGHKVIRFWNDDVLARTEEVLVVIGRAVGSPHPSPLPKGEGKS